MAIISTAPTYKAALVALLQADPNLAAVQVSYGVLARNVEHETVEVGGISWDEEDWSALGNRRKDETYSVALFIYVTKPGNTQQEATERALQLLGYVETLLRNNVVMAGVLWAQVVPLEVAEAPGEEGGMALVKANVVVKARK